MTTVWLCEPRSYGRNKAASPLPGRQPSVAVPHRSWEIQTNTVQKQTKSAFFLRPTCNVAFWTAPVYKKTKSVQNSVRSQKNRNVFSFYPPDPGTAPPLRRPDPRTHPGLRPRPRCPGVGPPRAAPTGNVARPRSIATMPGVCPTLPPALGSFRISHRKGTGPKRSGGVWSPPMPAHHAPPHPATVLARPAACSSFRPLPKPSSWRRSVAACSPCLCRAERPALELPELGKPVLTDLISTSKRDRERGGTAGVANCAQNS